MARRILLQEVERTTEQVVHEATHDVESFVWVLSYCVMRNLYHRASRRTAPKEVRDQMTFHPVMTVQEVLDRELEPARDVAHVS